MIEERISEKFKNVVTSIKNEIKTTQINTMQQINKNLIMMYFRIGKILNDNSKYGNSFIKNISSTIKVEYPNMKGFSDRNLKYMKKFYIEYKNNEKVQQLVAQLPWGHNILLMEKIKDKSIREFYVKATIENGWSRNMLDLQIKSNYHKRIGNSINNFKDVSLKFDSDIINNTLKDPYIFDFISLNNNYKEKQLEDKMIEKIKNVLLELGTGFSFVGSQYKLIVGENDYFIDLLFYHLKLKSYIVVELKATEFKPEYIGKMNFYLSAVDDLLKDENDNPSIGLILCKNKNKFIAQYSLKDVNKPIGISSFKLKEYLPSEEDLNMYIDLENN
jgi:predicted nuclease of restriction endonuclease-like (RecB) superfamily